MLVLLASRMALLLIREEKFSAIEHLKIARVSSNIVMKAQIETLLLQKSHSGSTVDYNGCQYRVDSKDSTQIEIITPEGETTLKTATLKNDFGPPNGQ